MTDIARDLAGTVDDYLISIARGLQKAQRELDLSAIAGDGPAEVAVRYSVPKLDFELRLTAHIVENKALDHRYRSHVSSAAVGKRHIVLKPLPITGNTQTTADFASVLTGSFVAVPVNQGRPGTVVSTSVLSTRADLAEFSVTVRNAVGEAVSNATVDFNIDRERSEELNNDRALLNETSFELGQVQTDENGVTTGFMTIADAEPDGTMISVIIDALGQTEELVYEVRS